MSETLIRWKLREVMDSHRIQAKELADRMDLSQNALSNLRKGEMPRIDGDRLNSLLLNLNQLRREGSPVIGVTDLIEFSLSLDEAKEMKL